jgi:hypothetical protein
MTYTPFGVATVGSLRDDYLIYDPNPATFTLADPYTITDDSKVIMAAGGDLYLPDAETRFRNGQRPVTIVAAAPTTVHVTNGGFIGTPGTTEFELVTTSLITQIRLQPVWLQPVGVDLYGWGLLDVSGDQFMIPLWINPSTGATIPNEGDVVTFSGGAPVWAAP